MIGGDESLAGQVAIVTGAAQGLGAAVARAYYRSGMKVALLDVQANSLHNLSTELEAEGGAGRTLPLVVDLSDERATEQSLATILTKLGTPRVMCHNAAILNVTPFDQMTVASWTQVLNISLQAAFILSHGVWKLMAQAGRGSIVYVSSRSGIEGFDGESAYCAAKHGLEGLMKSLAIEGHSHNIAVNTITPGMAMQTPMSERNYTDDMKKIWVDPMRLTPAFLTLAVQDASGITGQRCNAWELSQLANE